ncbi:MAG TPA: helix-turn-helix transcriptional regulator [Pseudonocardiaceae bacterium]|nr:helix-turn-helix transcriptional regulator [Pseudonocardiaceae bacterium]
MDVEEARTIGARARMIRRRRGLSLDVAAGLAGITKGYLSMLEHGQRGFNRRGLLEDLAAALGCSVVDLTGQPYLPPDRTSAETLAALPSVREVIYDSTTRRRCRSARSSNSPQRSGARMSSATLDATALLGASWEPC